MNVQCPVRDYGEASTYGTAVLVLHIIIVITY